GRSQTCARDACGRPKAGIHAGLPPASRGTVMAIKDEPPVDPRGGVAVKGGDGLWQAPGEP
ncbi:MAG: hypothetical protein ACK4H7_00950, partial [Acidilobaceae archaeon]